MSDRHGPSLRVDASCYGCAHHYSERVYLPTPPPEEDPDGLAPDVRDDHYCRCVDNGRLIGSRGGKTPKWCPFLPAEIQKLIVTLREEPKP